MGYCRFRWSWPLILSFTTWLIRERNIAIPSIQSVSYLSAIGRVPRLRGARMQRWQNFPGSPSNLGQIHLDCPQLEQKLLHTTISNMASAASSAHKLDSAAAVPAALVP